MANSPEQVPESTPKLTAKQQRFAEEYCVDWNGTQAAIRAGYAKKSAGAEACRLLMNVNIRTAIDARLDSLSLSAGQVTKHISDLAETRLNDFLTVKETTQATEIQQPLSESIRLLEVEIVFEEEYAVRSAELLNLSGEDKEDHLAQAQRSIRKKQLRVLEYQMRLERNPFATTTVAGPTLMVETVELDLVKLAKAKEGNRLKSWQPTEHGIKVEMYDAAAALRDMGRVRGIFEKDNSQASAVPVINTKVEIVTTGPPLARSEKEVDDV